MMFGKFITRKIARKVPDVVPLFWIIKLLTTAMGESTSDYLVQRFDPVVAVLVGAIGFSIVLVIQLWMKKYVAWVYWLTVTMVAIFGTMAADVVHIGLGIPYFISTICFAVLLGIIFFVWYRIEKTLSIHSINTSRREIFYWATVIATFALGTAAGDMTAVTFHLGYLTSGILFGILFLFPLLLYKFLGVNEIFCFWLAYIMTRPFGASFADFFGRTKDLGGIGFGTGATSIVLGICIIICVMYVTIRSLEMKRSHNTHDS